MRKVTFMQSLVNPSDHPQSGVECGFLGCLVNKLIRLTFTNPGQFSVHRPRLYKASPDITVKCPA